ncbi:MAG TPA: FTR1 family protein [Gaiellaceae bacterium]
MSGRRRIGTAAALVAGAASLAAAAAVTAHGLSDPSAAAPGTLGRTTVVFDSAVLVLREGLEAILVLAAITASFRGANAALRKPVAAGAGLALLATVATWFVAVCVLSAVNAPELDVQAATGLLAVVVLLVVMNWFLHRVYWTGWISHHTARRRRLLSTNGGRALVGFVLLGLTAVYREGFEVVLFLQNLRLQAGTALVLEGVGLGLLFTLAVGALTFVLNVHLPYRRMLIATGVLLAFVLLVMVGESAQELQLAGWIGTTSIGVGFPAWVGTWLALFPTVETLVAQGLALVVVVGSYFVAERLRVRTPPQVGTAQHSPLAVR